MFRLDTGGCGVLHGRVVGFTIPACVCDVVVWWSTCVSYVFCRSCVFVLVGCVRSYAVNVAFVSFCESFSGTLWRRPVPSSVAGGVRGVLCASQRSEGCRVRGDWFGYCVVRKRC